MSNCKNCGEEPEVLHFICQKCLNEYDKVKAAVAGMTLWLVQNQPDVWKRGIWDTIIEAEGKEVGRG